MTGTIRLNRAGIWIAEMLLSMLFLACGKQPGGSGNPLFTIMPASVTQADFVNHLDYDEQLKNKFNIYTYRNFYNGGGVALGDVNNDDLIDIFLTSNMGSNVLYLNKGNFEFEDISAHAGIGGKGQWSTGVSFADVNGDGWTDIYVCNSGNVAGDDRRNELYINNGNLTFSEKSAEYGLNDPGYSTHGAFFDYDKDGDLDLYLMNNSSRAIGSFNLKENQRFERDSLGGDRLFRNDDNIFKDVSVEAGIYGSVIGFGLGITIGDIDLDGWLDIYVSNDFFERDYIYMNNRNGTFRETLNEMMPSISAASMGADMADLNNDRYPEIFATDMVPEFNDRLKTKTTFDNWEGYKSNADNDYHHQFTRNMLHIHNGDGTFSEIGRLAGINGTDWSWGALMMDLDNDGLKDIFVANGIYKDLTDQDYIQFFSNRDMVVSIISGNKVDYKTLIDAIPSVKIPNYAYKNTGNYRFRNMASEWGLADPSYSNGSAYGDLDNDGDQDLVVNNVNMPVFIYRNETSQHLPDNHFLKVKLKGDPGNTDAIGAKVTARHQGNLVYVEQIPTRGFLSSIDPRPNLGLGSLTMVDSLIIEWPDDRITVLTNVQTDQILTLYQKDAVVRSLAVKEKISERHFLFENISSDNRVNFTHVENEFDDFRREQLIYHMMSTEGPRMCSGDVNGDGLDDLFICGAKDQPGALMIQRRDGTFVSAEKQAFETDRISEDVDCAMFDADGDGDIDLYVASGGNEFPTSSSALADRLYINDGQGHFVKSKQNLPAGKFESSSCVRAEDFDNDGVIELFVGIRLNPFLYGVPVNGYLLENDGKGKFSNVTPEIAPELKDVGMVRDMLWADVDQDGDKDMILAGDWMPVKVFLNDKGRFRENKEAFGNEKTQGWWNCLAAGDFDGDGDLDVVAGNHGLNSRFRASPDRPVTMFVNDFDLNGKVEQIICIYEGEALYPMALKHDLTRQIPSLEIKYPKYEMYKDQQITDIFPPEQLQNSIRLEASLLETSLFINDGAGNFTRKPLPAEVQFSPVFAAEVGDYNGDGNPDILLGGNLHHVKPEVGRYDASYGSFLAGDGKGGFTNVPAKISGFHVDGEIRDVLKVTTSAGEMLVISRSNGPVQVFNIVRR
jgi:hypothetical protein